MWDVWDTVGVLYDSNRVSPERSMPWEPNCFIQPTLASKEVEVLKVS